MTSGALAKRASTCKSERQRKGAKQEGSRQVSKKTRSEGGKAKGRWVGGEEEELERRRGKKRPEG